MILYDRCNQPYVEKLPEGYFPPTIHDFVQHGEKKVGMEYLVYSNLYEYYYISSIKENTPGRYIRSLIQQGLIFIHLTHKFLV